MNPALSDRLCTRISRANTVNPSNVRHSHPRKFLRSLLLCSTALVAGMTLVPTSFTAPSHAQTLSQTNPDAELLLKADQLIYDNDQQIVTAVGNVQLDYDGYNVVADRVSYNQTTRKVKASGNVEIIEPGGNRVYADEIDLTDDFGQGFVNALRVETPDNTRFAAESAERFADGKTVFNHGVYTACEPCREKPEKAPIWQVKAQQVILDGVTKTVSYRKASFELFGLPIAYLPYFSHADSSVKRKTGFLTPTAGYNDELGVWLRQPYFIATGESHDLTVAATGFSRQGGLLDARWRHQLENGFYSIKAAGISQADKDAFSTAPDNTTTDRGMIATTGRFDINPRWTFGWDVLAQSDSNFSRTYDIAGYKSETITNKVFLQGLNDRSFFNLSARQYLFQNNTLVAASTAFQFEDEQAIIRPSFDYNRVKTGPFTGGEISLDVNVTSLERDALGTTTPSNGNVRTHGFSGDTTRASADLSWRKSYVVAGLALTPLASVRGDWTTTNGFADANGPALETGDYTRFMPTAGLDVSYPLLVRMGGSSHVFEPRANIFLRPDLAFDGVAPNEDAQSLVFDASRLFDRDKFSGYDRIESGTRANVGLRYSGQFSSGLTLNALVGQSFHLAGENPYARTDDLTNTGEESGLENDRSDIVASFTVGNASRYSFNQQIRLDDTDFDIKRAESRLTFAGSIFGASANYTFIESQPNSGFEEDRTQVGFYASVKFAEHWSAFGAAQYDIQDDIFVSNSAGLSYADECFTFSLAFSETRSKITDEVDRSVGFKLGFRTLGSFGGSVDANALQSTDTE